LQAYEKQINGDEYPHYKCNGMGVSNAMMGKGGEPDEDTRYHYWVVCTDEIPEASHCIDKEDKGIKDHDTFNHGGRTWIIFPM
jgi:hypothetical protein